MEKVVPFRTGYGSGLCAAWYDGSFLFVLFTLSSGADGHVSGTIDYDVFGEPVTETGVFVGASGGSGGISALVFAYAGKPYDPVTGLSDYGFRDYAPTLARFTTVDPVRDGSNWYAYCNGDPVNYVDMWGLCESDNDGSNNGLYGERNHNGQYVLTVDVNNPEAYDAALSAYFGVRKYGAAGTTPVDSIALTNSSGQIIHTFSDEDAMLRYAGYNSSETSNLTSWLQKKDGESLSPEEASIQKKVGIVEMMVGFAGIFFTNGTQVQSGAILMADGAIVYSKANGQEKSTPFFHIANDFSNPVISSPSIDIPFVSPLP